MSKSYRVRTQVGVDKSVVVNLDQDFDFLEILSLKLSQSEIYIRECSDYGVIAGRVSVNDGYGIPNAKLSLFIPITAADELNPIISEIYPYKKITDINEDGYRYNLLPYKPSFPGHSPTGSFPDLEDVLTSPTAIELYDKYYKFTVTTNDSGDFMIFGVPVGSYTIVMNLDLSDMGPFSQSPQDLIRIGLATDSQVNGTKFQTSENLSTLPQIIFLNKTVEVLPLWGEPEICQPSITRTDFDLTAEANITIKPTSIFLGSIFSDVDKGALKRKCKPKLKSGQMCSLVSGPGQILAVRQTIKQDIDGRPILEEYELENNGNVIDYDGTWLLDVPMNMDYIITNEFGEQIFSNDERKGVPTKSKYRFKIRWTQTPDLSASVKRGTFLVPNVKEHGWTDSSSDPFLLPNPMDVDYRLFKASYAFSKDWADYGVTGDTQGERMIQDAIDCKDMFYEMTYNKVYTISQLITRYTKGFLNRRYMGIKNITDDECENSSNKLPTNDAQFKPDLLFFAFTILLGFITLIIKVVVKIFHVICKLLSDLLDLLHKIDDGQSFFSLSTPISAVEKLLAGFSKLNLPLYSYPDCEFCSCESQTSTIQPKSGTLTKQAQFVNNSILADFIDPNSYDWNNVNDFNEYTPAFQQMFAGFQGTNPATQWTTFRTPQISLFRQDNDGDGDGPMEYVGIYTLDLPLHERVNLMNFKGKFFGNGNWTQVANNSPLNVAPGNSYGTGTMLGGGTSQIKVCFNTDLNWVNLNWDQQPNNSPDLTSTGNGFHYDNVLILAIEEKYEAGTILTFNNPLLFNDLNLSGITPNFYGASSITGTPINVNSATTINVSHTNPYTGDRLVTAYRLNQTNEDKDNYLRYPTDIEYFQVITAMTLNEIGLSVPMDSYADMRWGSFIFRVIDRWSGINLYSLTFGGYFPGWSYGNPWMNYTQKESTYFTILVRGVDPHSTRQPVTYGLGRLFSNNDHWRFSVSGNYKLNIPLQPNDGRDFGDVPTTLSNTSARNKAHRCVKHDGLGNTNSGIDVYSSGRTFFKSFHFKPSPTQWTQFRTRSIYKYSSLSETDITANTEMSQPSINPTNMGNYATVAPGINGGGLRVGVANYYTRKTDYAVPTNYSIGEQFQSASYVPGESIEGGSMILTGGANLDPGGLSSVGLYYRRFSAYYSRKYVEPTQDYDCFLMSDSERIVMRSDRMPTSDRFQVFGNNSMTMMANGQFYITEVSDEGIVSAGSNPSPTFLVNEPEIIVYNPAEPEIPNKIAALLDTFTCNSLVPIECYQSDPPDSIYVKQPADCQYYQGERYFIEGSCYSLVRPPYNQPNNVKNDRELVNEWYSRMNINFGACREVFAHGFFNSWINGTLYAFPFRNTRYFTGPNANPPSQPYNKLCTTNIFLHPDTFNFYYRSAPYKDSGSRFVGRDGEEDVGGNKKNHMYPTTIMDLGPRDELQKFLSQSGNWDGYIMNKLESTTFGDTSDLLNIFVLSRLANTSFTTFFKSRTSSVLNFFDSRKRKFVDGDFAQMIATNSQFGIAAYEPESYPEPTGTTFNSSLFLPTFFDKTGDVVFGIFYTGDSQARDYISPNRTIYNPNGRIGADDACAFSYIPLKTQVVPFYLWEIRGNVSVSNIFGNQKNNWSPDIFSYGYQKIDRFYSASKNFQPDPNINQINYHKGWIYNVDDYSTIDNPINDATGEFDYKPTTGLPGHYLLGAPFYFYFGLTKGASAFDRFTAKWIDTDGFA